MPRSIPKSERPWRQRLADAARLRNSNVTDDSANALANLKILAARTSRRQSINQTITQHSSQNQQANQQLQTQISEIRNLVTEDKV